MPSGTGFGKVILFGEHFVVHGSPSIGLGISRKTTVELKQSKSLKLWKGASPRIREATQRILGRFGTGRKYSIEVESELPVGAGLGWSASYSVALVRAVAKDLGSCLNDWKVAEFSFEGEKAFHGNPSGIDNTLSTYGGALWFRRGFPHRRIPLGSKFHFLVSYTGKSGPTKELVAGVTSLKERMHSLFSHLMDAEAEVVKRGEAALSSGDAKSLGELMNVNHGLLSAVGVSSPELEEIMAYARSGCGALGAKLTGAGGGGCAISLYSSAKAASSAEKKMGKKGYRSFTFSV